MTDVLGVCTSWGDGPLRGRSPRPGDPVEIALRRHRVGQAGAAAALGAAPGQRARRRAAHASRCGRGVETEPLGEWVLRTDPAPGRAAAQAGQLLPGDRRSRHVDLAGGRARVRAFYAALGPPGAGAGGARLRRWTTRWSPPAGPRCPAATRTSCVGLAGAGPARRAPGRCLDADAPGAAVWPEPRVSEDRTACWPRSSTATGAAAGRAALDGDWLGLHELAVDPAYRRRGLATRRPRRAAGVGRRAGRDHGLAARRDRQRPRPGALRGAGPGRAPHLPLPRGAVRRGNCAPTGASVRLTHLN